MASKVENEQTGYVWEGEAESFYAIENIYFPYATNEDDVDACAFGIDAEGGTTRDATVVSAGKLSYNAATGYWTCLCPFEGCVKWKLFIWRKNEGLSARELSWDGKSAIPVSSIIEDSNLLKRRVKDMTTHTGRSLKVPEEGETQATFVPPKEARAGKILGFDANGNPATGEDVAQVKEFFEQKDLCKDYVLQAKNYANSAEQSASNAEQSASDAREHREDAAKSAEESEKHAFEALANLEKVQMAGADAVAKIEEAEDIAVDHIDAVTQDAQVAVEEKKSEAERYAKAAERAAERSENSAEESATCADLADADRIRCEELVKSISGALRTEVVASLPETGETGVFYFVGNDETGYEEFIWDSQNGIFIRLGSTDFSALRPATETQYGLVRLGTNEVQTTSGGPVGVTESGKAFVAKATLTRYGTICTSAGGAVFPTGYAGTSIYDMGGEVGMFTNGRVYARAASIHRFGTVCLSADNYVYPTDWAPEGEVPNYDRMGGEIGFNVNGRIYARSASLNRFGTVKLGSQFQPTNAQPYVVGIGASSNDGMRGQLAFNLARIQPGTESIVYPDGSTGLAGSLKYSRVPNVSGIQYQLYVETASASQLGVVRMLGSLSGYTDEEVESMRSTHAASVGLVLDGVKEFGENFFTDERIRGYFDKWALDKDLAQQIWDDEEKRNALTEAVFSSMISSEEYRELVKADVDAKAEEIVTDAYMHELFDADVHAYAEAYAKQYWDDEISANISRLVDATLPGKVEEYYSVYFNKVENVEKLGELVYESAKAELEKNANAQVSAYMNEVFSNKRPITVDGTSVLWRDWVSNEIQKRVDSATSGFEGKLTSLKNELVSKIDGIPEIDTAKSVFQMNVEAENSYEFTKFVGLNLKNFDAIAVCTRWSGGEDYRKISYIVRTRDVIASMKFNRKTEEGEGCFFSIPLLGHKDPTASSREHYYDEYSTLRIFCNEVNGEFVVSRAWFQGYPSDRKSVGFIKFK